jgi:ribosomal protein S13
MGTFEQRYKLHPLTYIYGMKDTGKSSMIILALSIIAENYQQLVAGATSLHTILQQLADKDYIPVLIDEFHKFDKIRDTVIQMLKDIATNGGKFVKGTVATRTMLEEYRLKASPILASEFRDQLIDPSFYQRCIELNLNDFPRINLKKSMEFNELLDMDKTFIFLDLLNFITRNAKPLSEDEIIQMFPDYDLLEGKKRSSSFLQIISYLLAANFYKSVGLDYTGKVKNVINVYLENEVKQNSKTARVASISEEAMSSIFTYVKVDPALILNNIHIEVSDIIKESVSIKTWRGFLTGKQLNFRNEHLLNELSCKPKTVKAAGGRFFTSNISIEVSLPNIVTLIELLLVYSGNQPEAVINMAEKQKDTLMRTFNMSKSKWNILSGAEEEIILNKQEPTEVKTEVINGLFGKTL